MFKLPMMPNSAWRAFSIASVDFSTRLIASFKSTAPALVNFTERLFLTNSWTPIFFSKSAIC